MAFRRGEEAAVKVIYQRFYKPLCFFAARVTGEPESARDLVTEVFIRLLERRSEIGNLNHCRSFLSQ